MKQIRLLTLLVLLMTAATGAWAQDAKHLITATYDEQTRSLEQPLPYATTVGVLYEAVTGESFNDLISRMSLVGMTLSGIGSTNTSVVSVGELNGASTPVTVNADGKAAVALRFGSYAKGIFVSVISPLYVTMADGTKDAAKWTAKVGDGEAQALPIGGLKGDGSETVTLQYTGRLKVKGVKATSDAAPAAGVFAANEYNEASWDGTKVVFTKKTAASDPTAVANSDADVTWDKGWYTVSGNVTINGKVTLTNDVNLILQDGATLTINGQLDSRTNGKNLNIYGQDKGDGKLNVSYSDNMNGTAIYGDWETILEIHGGEITAAAIGDTGMGLEIDHFKMYGGKLTSTSKNNPGIQFTRDFEVYGGEVVGTTNSTSTSSPSNGIYGINGVLTVYGGKVTATGNGINDTEYGYGSGFGCKVQSGTTGIKFYFSDNGTDWDPGTGYGTATTAPTNRYAKAE